MPHVTIYSKKWCPYCVQAKDLLNQKGIPFEEINVDSGRELFDAMVAKSRGRTTVPQIFFGETHVGGCDDLYALEASGGLDKLVTA